MSSSLVDDKGTEIFIVQIARNTGKRKIFASQKILEILSIEFLVRQVIDSNVGSFAGKGNDCCSIDARVATCDKHVETLQSPSSVVAVLTTAEWDCEIGL